MMGTGSLFDQSMMAGGRRDEAPKRAERSEEARATRLEAEAADGASGASGDGSFVAAKAFGGARPGMVFKKGAHGVGYYKDALAPAPAHAPAMRKMAIVEDDDDSEEEEDVPIKRAAAPAPAPAPAPAMRKLAVVEDDDDDDDDEPPISFIALSIASWSVASMPMSLGAMRSLTLETAVRTPLPMWRSPPSRSSTASYAPVDAPDGTDARDMMPPATMSTSTVGLPRLSYIWRALIDSIVAIWTALEREPAAAGGAQNRDERGRVWRGRKSAEVGDPAPFLPTDVRTHRRGSIGRARTSRRGTRPRR